MQNSMRQPAPPMQSKYLITDPRVFEQHQAKQDDFIRARRLEGVFYDPIFDQDMSQFKTRDEEDETNKRPVMQEDREEEFRPETIDDLLDYEA